MIVLGINSSHNATACLLKDGAIIACVSEERLSRIKNQSGFPVLAVKEVLDIANLKPDDIDLLVLSFNDPKVNAGYAALADASRVVDKRRLNFKSYLLDIIWWTKEHLLASFPRSRVIYEKLLPLFYKVAIDSRLQKKVLLGIEKETGIHSSKVVTMDHHEAHAYSAYYSSPKSNNPKLILTLDGMGDGLCASVSIAKNGTIKRISQTQAGSSIGDLYSFVTHYLGMKMGEHEYKVMGLAPYASPSYVNKTYEKIKDLVWVNPDLSFGTKIHSHIFYRILPKLLVYERFDNISGAIQKLTEDLLVDWIRKSIKKTKISDVVCGGGVFMNVKANQKVVEMKEVKSLFVMPSCGDESTAIGAAYWGYEHLHKKDPKASNATSLTSLYLGRKFSDAEVLKELKKSKYRKFSIKKIGNIERKIASLLGAGKVVARFAGKMEWGARSLGNRSILSHPANLDAIRTINDQIKSRDFWMPFAPSLILEKSSKYIASNGKIEAPYMIVTFDTTDSGKTNFKAAMHQYDLTLRPQLVEKDWNKSYYKVLREFEKITGIGGVLNTSFNLHGYPIVCSPSDALHVFENSGLQYLAIENYLVWK